MNRRLAAVLALGLAVTAGCTKASNPNTTPSTTAAAATSATTDAASPTLSDSSASSSTSVSSSPIATKTTKPAGTPACKTAALTVTVQRGSGAAGQQFASLRFKNKSSSSCSLTGFPGVVLLKGGAQLAKPATRSSKPNIEVVLSPQAIASAQLTNDSTCNAENSDSVQVIVPGQTEKVVLPLSFRGCNGMFVDPVVSGSGG
jgi:hypothetical protein